MQIDTLREQLAQLNQEIAAELKTPAATVTRQRGELDADALFLYGIVGGKDVGKTSLINHLAGSVISIDSDILDEGTRTTVAYCHQQDLPAVMQRLGSSARERVKFVTHDRQSLQNVVLMDLPDFDSRFDAHLADVRRLTRYLQGLLWVTTPRKYGDNELLKQLAVVAQSHENYFILVNKIDQLNQKVALETVRREVFDFIAGECQRRHIRPPQIDRLFLLSAIEPDKYEFKSVYDRLIRPHSAQEIRHAKLRNVIAEFEQNLHRMDAAYHLDARLKLIDASTVWIHQQVMTAFGDAYLETVSRRLSGQQHVQRRICKSVFAWRVKRWPILRTLFFPLTGIVAVLGGRLNFESQPAEDGAQALLRHDGKSAVFHLFALRDELLAKFPDLQHALGPEPDFPKLLAGLLDDLVQAYEHRLTDVLMAADTRPGLIKRGLIYFPLIWFPFLQPLLLKFNTLEGVSSLSLAHLQELAVFMISLLGAGALLTSLSFLCLFYSLLLMILYAQVARAVQKQGKLQIQDLWHEKILSALERMLTRPIMDQRTALATQQAKLKQIESEFKAITDVPPEQELRINSD